MTTPSGASPDENPWQRPTTPPPGATGSSTTPGRPTPYPGPPRAAQPPADWRPPVHLQPPPPRRLPAQDEAALDEAEQQSRTLTRGVGVVAGVLVLVLVCLLCSRLIF